MYRSTVLVVFTGPSIAIQLVWYVRERVKSYVSFAKHAWTSMSLHLGVDWLRTIWTKRCANWQYLVVQLASSLPSTAVVLEVVFSVSKQQDRFRFMRTMSGNLSVQWAEFNALLNSDVVRLPVQNHLVSTDPWMFMRLLPRPRQCFELTRTRKMVRKREWQSTTTRSESESVWLAKGDDVYV